jgi:ribosomal silencing factor RsfS
MSVLASRPMSSVLDALVAFVDEHRRCGELDGGLEDGRVWMVCDCGADIVHAVEPASREQLDCG